MASSECSAAFADRAEWLYERCAAGAISYAEYSFRYGALRGVPTTLGQFVIDGGTPELFAHLVSGGAA